MNLLVIPIDVTACPVCGGAMAFDGDAVVCVATARKAQDRDTKLGDLCSFGVRVGSDLHKAFAVAADKAVEWRGQLRKAA